ncbi:MAG: SMC family ATPase [Nanoarchaeota archaeon]
MIIKSLKLQNIRSYNYQEISFPIGTTLLSGDIGSGKSTIFLAIEFALFGLRRTYLTGTSLLRHGKNLGYVELNFDIDGKNISLKRTLRRARDEVNQSDGYIVIDGIKKNCSPVELRYEVFNLLGYPKELLTKGKDLVYRYTVYTPQEEMKQILAEERDARLDILRRIFNIDKYKRIRENTVNLLLRDLREKKKYFEAMSSDLEIKRQERASKQTTLKNIELQLVVILKSLSGISEEISKNKQIRQELEQKIKNCDSVRNDMRINEIKAKNKSENIKENEGQIMRIRQQVKTLSESIDTNLLANLNDISLSIKDYESELEITQKSVVELNSGLSRLTLQKSTTLETIKRISSLQTCPSCLQNVPSEHKNGLISKEKIKIDSLSNEISVQTLKLKDTTERTLRLRQGLQELKNKVDKGNIMKLRAEGLQEKELDVKRLLVINQRLSEEILLITQINSKLEEELGKSKDIASNYKNLLCQIEELLMSEKELVIKKARAENEKENVIKNIEQLDKDISEKEKFREQLEFLSQLNNWIGEFFLNLLEIIERNIMLSIHQEFTSLFQRWFNALIDDDTISVSIDEGFSPQIEQNGYDTTIENLSGGEKTSVALAYRLALNKVINDIISGMNTKDILMLDEPTDGFSTEQLDKVREVLNQINVKQIIIVSHEQKIEGFVENVIRIEKENSESCIL